MPGTLAPAARRALTCWTPTRWPSWAAWSWWPGGSWTGCSPGCTARRSTASPSSSPNTGRISRATSCAISTGACWPAPTGCWSSSTKKKPICGRWLCSTPAARWPGPGRSGGSPSSTTPGARQPRWPWCCCASETPRGSSGSTSGSGASCRRARAVASGGRLRRPSRSCAARGSTRWWSRWAARCAVRRRPQSARSVRRTSASRSSSRR